MVTFQQLTIPGRLMNLNEYQNECRKNRYSGSKAKKSQQQIVEACILAARLKPMIEPVDIRFHWIEPNMRRDKDNIRFASKFILDALVSMGILKNDGWRNISTLSDRYSVNAQNPRIVVTITTSYERGTDETNRATSHSNGSQKSR